MLVEEHYMGCVVCLDCRDNTAVLPSGCISARKFMREESLLSMFFIIDIKPKRKRVLHQRNCLARLTRLCLHFIQIQHVGNKRNVPQISTVSIWGTTFSTMSSLKTSFFFSSVSPPVALLMKESQKDASGYLSLLASIPPPAARPPISPLSTSLPPLHLPHFSTSPYIWTRDRQRLCASLSPS